MCYEPTARPPLPPIAGGAGIAGTEDVVLEASDGNRFVAHVARTAEHDAPGVVVLPDVRGLHPFYRDLAERFAQTGVHATAMDYFGRTAGTGERPEGFDHMSHVQQTRPETVALDVAATVGHLRSEAGGGAGRVFTVGFCFGGRHSLNQAVDGRQGLAGVIGFYGVPQRRDANDGYAPVDLAARYACPVLGLWGTADAATPVEEIRAFERALGAAGVQHEIATYDGAPHSFFDKSYDAWKDACDDAWRRVLRFVGAGAGGA